MLVALAVHGQGRWPWRWRLRPDDANVLSSLARKGLVAGEGRFATLTDPGRVAASFLHGEPACADPVVML